MMLRENTARRRLLAALLWSAVIVAGMGAIEIALRMAGRVYVHELSRDSALETPPHEEETVILCLGESTTAGLWVDLEDSYPKVLERKLSDLHPESRIRVVAPPYIGQNTSQILSELPRYLEHFRPDLVILMVGANNEWALGRSNIRQYFGASTRVAFESLLLVTLSDFRLFKVMRYLYLSLADKAAARQEYPDGSDVLGESRNWPWPPRRAVWSFAREHPDAFLRMWQAEVGSMIELAKAEGADVLLMTYPAHIYIPPESFVEMAELKGTGLIRNDLIFADLVERHSMEEIYFEDRWHPREIGYQVIARNIVERIERTQLAFGD